MKSAVLRCYLADALSPLGGGGGGGDVGVEGDDTPRSGRGSLPASLGVSRTFIRESVSQGQKGGNGNPSEGRSLM